eukprot:g2070.t1
MSIASQTSFGMGGHVGRNAYFMMMQGRLRENYKKDFPEAALKGEIYFGGVLKKTGRDFFRTVKKRYFVIRNNFLVYYKSEAESKKGTPVGAFSCKLLVNVIAESKDISLVFASGFTQYLEAPDKSSALKWKYHLLKHKHVQKLKLEKKRKRLKEIKRKIAGATKSSIMLRRNLLSVRGRKDRNKFVDDFLFSEEKSAVL